MGLGWNWQGILSFPNASLCQPPEIIEESHCVSRKQTLGVSRLMGLEEEEAGTAFVKKTHKYIR